MQRKFTLGLATGMLAALLTVSSSVSAQNSATDDIAKYREMIADGNPSELYEAAGEDLWKKPAGPKNATLEKCDLGLGPGVVKGAAAQLPRYFKDTNKVQDLESRLITCMQKLQGRDSQEMIDAPFQKGPKKDMEAIVAYVVTLSKGDKIKVSTAHPKEKEMYELGKRAFFFQGGPMDFSCASCHGEDGKLGASGAKDLSTSHLTDAQIKKILQKGKNAMPPMSTILETADNMEFVIQHIKTLRK